MVAEQLVAQMDELRTQFSNHQAALVNLATKTEGLENAMAGKISIIEQELPTILTRMEDRMKKLEKEMTFEVKVGLSWLVNVIAWMKIMTQRVTAGGDVKI